MEWWQYLLTFSGGILFGLIVSYVADALHDHSGLDAFSYIIFSPFRWIKSLFKSKRAVQKAVEEIKKPAAPPQEAVVDAREQRISDSAQTIRSILLTLASVIKRTDEAASNASSALVEVKSSITNAGLPPELAAAQALLITEIDRVVAHNLTLKNELSSSQAILSTQRHQIEELKTAVRVDGLTQLANRAYFDEKLAEMVALRQRYSDPFSLMMIDVDNFKTINDTYGHVAGDRILIGMASKIKAALRASDFLARFGGDEFALILIKADIKTATNLGWKIHANVVGSRFMLDKVAIQSTLSMGVAEARQGESPESLMKRADAALYRVKAAGRNGVQADETT